MTRHVPLLVIMVVCPALQAGPVNMEEIRPILKALDVLLAVEQRPPWPEPPLRAVEVTLIPQVRTATDDRLPISFALPLGPGWLEDPRALRLEDEGGREIPLFTHPLVFWWTDGRKGTPRSVLVQFELDFPDGRPRKVSLRWGKARAEQLASQIPVAETLLVQRVEPAGENFKRVFAFDFHCPRVLAILPSVWLCASLVAWQQTPAAENNIAAWYDKLLLAGFEQSVSYIAARSHEPQLFDRVATYAKMYVRFGEERFLLAALRAGDAYLQHLTSDGYFDLKPGARDLKYSSNEGLAILYMLTGDDRFLDGVRRVARAWSRYSTSRDGSSEVRYNATTPFWTERHHAFGMLAALHGYEIEGRADLLERTHAFFEAALEMQVRPADGKPPDGAWAHSAASHGDGNGWTTSPWMSAFLLDALWKYWMLTDDPRAAASLALYAKFMSRYGVTADGKTFYMANSPGRGQSEGPMVEHNVEGFYILLLGYYFSAAQDRSFLRQADMLIGPVMVDDLNLPPR
ncbi:MAG: hypothetical protein ACUVWX_11205 [Kiritimatiellia bacterium]